MRKVWSEQLDGQGASQRQPISAAAQAAEMLQSLLGNFHQSGESGGIVHSQVGENLAVQLDASLLQAVHKHGVGQAVHASSSVDAGDPETTNLALLVATIAIGVLERVLDLLFSSTIGTGLCAIVTLGALEHGAALLVGGVWLLLLKRRNAEQ